MILSLIIVIINVLIILSYVFKLDEKMPSKYRMTYYEVAAVISMILLFISVLR